MIPISRKERRVIMEKTSSKQEDEKNGSLQVGDMLPREVIEKGFGRLGALNLDVTTSACRNMSPGGCD